MMPVLTFLSLLAALAAGETAAPQELGKKKSGRASVKILATRPEKSELKAGDVVKVAFDLEIQPGWHIYPAAKEPILGKRTLFSFTGAEIAGPIEEPKPTLVKEPGVGDLDYHEGKVTITVPLKIAAATVSGKIEYQICNPNLCQDNETAFSFQVKLQPGAPAPAPQDKDPEQPEVKFLSVTPSKTEVKIGETFVVAFQIEIPKTWHIYPAAPTTTGVVTDFEFPGVESAGKIEEPKTKTHPAEKGVAAYEYHEGTITLKAPLRLKEGAKVGPLELKGHMTYMICDPNNCWPGKTPVSFKVTVVEGQAPSPPKESLGGFLLVAMGGGLLSLVMPCVYPLIPITITYFLKQGAGNRAKSLGLSFSYALGIVSVFTGVGFLFSLLIGAAGAREFATWPWVNICVALLFFWFAFSLFGLYEITLPSWVLGPLTGKQRSGVGGAFVLGGLFSVVTFTCTIPVAANILVVAATSGASNKFVGLLGMLVYSATMAAPFIVLGLAPSLISGVKKGSGDWLHTVKVTAGFAELALALFYLAKADQVQGWDILTRPVMISVWVAVLAAMGLYLLRVFQLKGDEVDPAPADEGGAPARRQVGVVRMLVALLFLVCAVYVASGFSGRPLGLFDIVLPVNTEPTTAVAAVRDPGAEPAAGHATLPPAEEEARKTGRPLFVEFTGIT